MIKCSIGLLLDAFENTIPDWDNEEKDLFNKVIDYCKTKTDKDGLVSVSKVDLNFMSSEDKGSLLAYIIDNLEEDTADPFELTLILNLAN